MGRVIKWAGCVALLFWAGENLFAQPTEQLIWHHSSGQWNQADTLWQLDATGAGQAWVYACLNSAEQSPDSLGRTVRVRWSADFASSINNFSRLHFFSPIEGANEPPIPVSGWTANSEPMAPGSFLHLGSNGNQDAIEWRRVLESMPDGELFPVLLELQPGLFAESMDAWLTWTQLPGDTVATLSIESILENGAPTASYGVTHAIPTCIGLSTQFTTSNIDAIEFELEQFSPFIPDTCSPKLSHITWEGDSVLLWHFNEPVRSELGQVTFNMGSLVHFPEFEGSTKTFRSNADTHWIAGHPRFFDLAHFTDLVGNILIDTTVQVVWNPPNTAHQGDIVLTEIMADPTPHAYLPACEWAEVLNRSDRHFQIKHWFWWDEGANEIIPLAPRPPWDGILIPGERFLISGCEEPIVDGATHEAFIDGAAAFNDAGDGLGLLRWDGSLLDAIHYRQSWWNGENGGVSLQNLQPGACAAHVNWTGSQDPDGCSPGFASEQENFAALPNDSLMIAQIVPTSSNTGFIEFNAAVDPLSSWECLPKGSITCSLDDAFPERMHWSQHISTPDQDIQFQVLDVKSCYSDWSSMNRFSFKVKLKTAKFPEPKDLVIAEISPSPLGSSAVWGEFIEIFNLNDSLAIEIGGVQCGDYVCQERRILQVGERWVVFPGNLPNETGNVVLKNASGKVLDEVHYSACWHPNRKQAESGFSLVRVDVNGPAQNSRNWTSSGNVFGASPGTTDPAEHLDSWSDEPIDTDFDGHLLMHGISADETYFLFSRPVWLDSLRFHIPALQESISGFEYANVNTLWAQSSAQSIPDSILAMDVRGQLEWFQTSPSESNTNEPASAPKLFLNEVLDADAFGEPFIEISHTASTAVGTANWFISTEEIPFPSDWIPLATGVSWQIPPHQPWALAACPNRLNTPHAIAVSLPSLFGRKQVHLQSPSLAIETVSLHPDLDAPWSTSRVTSLERMQSSDLSQWQSSSHPSGSTPGERNSWNVRLEAAQTSNFPSIELIQSTWSRSSHNSMPGAVLYALRPGAQSTVWQAHVAILSVSGQAICRLPNSPWIAPGQQTLIGAWDGRNEHGILAAPGSYLLQVIFEMAGSGLRIQRVAPVHVAPAY